MSSAKVLFVFLCSIAVGLLQGTGSGTNGNLRVCIVEGRGSYKRAPKYCPVLDEQNYGVECVLGTDRLDCLRRISKGTVDFGVFSPEDLVAAQWADIDVLVTNEIRHRDRPFERNVVALVNRRILREPPSTLHAVLMNTTLCHPGVGAEDIRPLSDTLSGYLETLVLERSCDPSLSMVENRIKALAGYFGKACKAGPWVVDKTRDEELKRKYPSLCAACGSSCDAGGRYWGAGGALECLATGRGDVTWAEYDDVTAYFGLNSSAHRGSEPLAGRDQFALLCRDGTWVSLDTEPCVWLHRPWSVVVAKRKAAEAVSKLMQSLTTQSVPVDNDWRGALAALVESATALGDPLAPPAAPQDYLARAKGFREAYSQTGCDPPRHITLCATSPLARNKCEWLSEAGAVYGVSPPLQCIYDTDSDSCMTAVSRGDADIAVETSDWIIRGRRDYNLTPILHEVTPIVGKTNTIMAYVKNNGQISKMADLRGKRAAFPNYDGFSWHSVMNYLKNNEKVSCMEFANGYFAEICAPGVKESGVMRECYEKGELNALNSLLEGKSDVAFISMLAFNNAKLNETLASKLQDITPICSPENTKYCYLSWSAIGHVFASNKLPSMRRQEIVNVLESLDKLFGKHPPFHMPMFAMYGPFNHELDVLFHNNTRILTSDRIFKTHPYDIMPLNFESQVSNVTDFSCSFGAKVTPCLFVLVLSLLAVIF